MNTYFANIINLRETSLIIQEGRGLRLLTLPPPPQRKTLKLTNIEFEISPLKINLTLLNPYYL